jgi:hypothetical protein
MSNGKAYYSIKPIYDEVDSPDNNIKENGTDEDYYLKIPKQL